MSGPDLNRLECGEIRELFSVMLDGELADGERGRLEKHLLVCEECRLEFELWQRIADTLRGEEACGEPSADFCAGVMSRIRREAEVKPRRKLAGAWRVPAAAAAAAVMMFAGSWGVSVALKGDKPPTVVVIDQTQPGTGQDPAPANPETNVPGPNPQSESAGNVPGAGSVPEAAGSNNAEAGTAPRVTADQPRPAGTVANAVLLSSQKDVLSTILKLSVANPDDSQHTALALAANYAGSGQVLDSQKRGAGELVIMRLTVPRNAGRNMVAQLSGLGGIIDRADESKDITDNYNQAVNRLNEIQSRMAAGLPAGEAEQLEAEASGLRRQIASWDSEAASYSVILWLEH